MKKLYIEILLKDIISELKKINAYKCIVAKSNFYGYGYKMLNYIYDYFDCIVVADEYEANTIKLLCPLIKKRFIVLYGQCVREKEEDMYDIVDMSEQNVTNHDDKIYTANNSYLRCDCFIAMHGITLKKCLKQLNDYKGILVHINEFLTKEEELILYDIDKYLYRLGKKLNIGGSSAETYLNTLKSDTEFRFARKVLFDNNKPLSNFVLHIPLLNQRNLNCNEVITLGYKSNEIKIQGGYLYLIEFGYGNCSLWPRIYEKKIKLYYENQGIVLSAYPCMNTSWIWSQTDLNIQNQEIVLFKRKKDIEKVCNQLEIDMDEFFTSFSDCILREYIV